jgi:hypothetical protein
MRSCTAAGTPSSPNDRHRCEPVHSTTGHDAGFEDGPLEIAAQPLGKVARRRGRAVHRAAVDHYGIDQIELEIERRPQRAGRHDTTIADAACAVDHGKGEVLGEAGVLQAVVHDDDVDGGEPCGNRTRTPCPVAADEGRPGGRQE